MTFELPRIKLLGRDDDLLLAIGATVAGVAAVAYITTAVTAEAQRRWEQVAGGAREVITMAAGASGAAGLAMGLPVGRRKAREEGRQEGFDEGFWTPNPAITPDQRDGIRDAGRDARGGGSAVAGMVVDAALGGVAAGVSGVVADTIADRFMGPGPSAETIAPPKPTPAPAGLDRDVLELMTVAQLRQLTRSRGKGGDGLSSASKGEIIRRLLKG